VAAHDISDLMGLYAETKRKQDVVGAANATLLDRLLLRILPAWVTVWNSKRAPDRQLERYPSRRNLDDSSANHGEIRF
jgi:hypothetical protein